ncbi:hypothetical protein REPUB_Repub07fG0164700 [Reevesia pubescens]
MTTKGKQLIEVNIWVWGFILEDFGSDRVTHMNMEQQLESLFPKKKLWVDRDGEEDDEEEVGVALLARHSRHPTNGVVTTPTSSGELEPPPASASALAPKNGTTSEHSHQEEDEQEEEEAATADDSHRNGEVSDENEEDKVVKEESNGNSVYFDKLQGTESTNGISEMQSEIPTILSTEINHQRVKNVEDQNFFGLGPAPIEQLHEETNISFKHCDNTTKIDTNVDLMGEIEEDLMELDVERVLEKQNTHDLYCPNCKSCITQKVILVRRKPKFSNIRHKPKRVKTLDPIPNSVNDGRSGDTPEIHSNVSPTAAPDEQNNGRQQEQEAFSCLSCFSIFIPIGNGCFKIFQFFKQGRQNEYSQSPQGISQRENTQSPQEISHRENTQNPQRINSSENTHNSQETSQKEKTQSPRGISQNENRETPSKVSSNEDTHSRQHINHNEGAQNPRHISRNEEDAQSPQKISHNENTQSPLHINQNESKQRDENTQNPQKISRNENTQSPQDINQNQRKQSPQKIPTAKTNWIFSIFAFHKSKAIVENAGPASLVQSASIPTQSVTNREHIDAAAITPKEPGIGNIFSSTNSSLLDKVKAESREKKPDADIYQRNTGDNEIEDLEAGLLEPTLYPKMEVASSSQSRTQNEHRGAGAGEAHEWEIIKSIVYGGLIESITSLGVVSSAAGAGADTLNVLALGLANVIGGLVIISHNLRELKNDQPRGACTEINIEEDRYQVLLGRRQNFVLHVIVAILSFLVFGLVPPVVYGFSFRKSDDKDLKLAAVAGTSLVCIILLALGKGHVRKSHRTYFRTVSYYVALGIAASGISYLVGELIKKLLGQLGMFESSSAVSVPFLETIPLEVGRASY